MSIVSAIGAGITAATAEYFISKVGSAYSTTFSDDPEHMANGNRLMGEVRQSGLISSIISGGLSMSPIGAALGLVGTIIGRIFPDKTQVMLQQFMLNLQSEMDDTELAKIQGQVNLVEAASSNIFLSGWRPAVGWICVCGLGWGILQNVFVFIAGMCGYHLPYIPLDAGYLSTLLVGMLGFGGLRTYEKKLGINS